MQSTCTCNANNMHLCCNCAHMNVTVIVTYTDRFCSIQENGCFKVDTCGGRRHAAA